MRERTYDPHCYDLAEHFLREVALRKGFDAKRMAVLKDTLAKDIQEIVEDFFMMEGLS